MTEKEEIRTSAYLAVENLAVLALKEEEAEDKVKSPELRHEKIQQKYVFVTPLLGNCIIK